MTKLVNRAKMTTATTGTGTITLGSAVDGYQTFANAGVVNADVVRYVIEDGDAWEIGLGTYTATGTTLTRGSIESSNADNALNLTGTAVVFVSASSGDIQQPPAEGAFVDGDKTKLDGIEAGATADQTAAEILTAIKTVDGAGSGLDADLLDGQQGSYYYPASNPNGYTTNVGDITGVTAGSFVTGGGTSGTVTVNVDATSANTASKVVARDASGNFSAGTITAALAGNASTASTLQTSRNIALTGAVTGDANFNGGGNISIATTATSDPTLTLAGDATGSATFTNLGNATLTVTVVDDSHNHIIGNVDGLQTALDGKLSTSGKAADSNLLDGLDSTDFARFSSAGTVNNALATAAWVTSYGDSTNVDHIWHDDGTNQWNFNSDTAFKATANSRVNAGSFYANGNQVFHDGYHPNADTLTTARTINGTSFNGSANITTANWGTARTLTIGSTGKSVNGSGNVAWSLAEIGAPSTTGVGASGTWGINITGNAATASNASLLNSISAVNLYNNMGGAHSTRTSFDATTPSYDFGYRFVQGTANGPGTGGSQFYSWYIGLGGEYPATGAGSYGAMFAVDRNSTTPYLSVRYNEANSFGSWRRISAGRADTLTTARTINGTSFNGSANITTASWGTARTLSFTGDVTGSASVNGSANVATSLNIAANVVGANELNVSGNGTTAQFLRSDGDGSFTWATPTDTNTTYSAGNGIDLSGTTFSVAAGGGLTQNTTGLSHADTSSQASVNNSGSVYIQDITLDTYGHVTGIVSTTVPASAPTTAQVLSATAGASAGEVGTYAFLANFTSSTVNIGSTVAGSSLYSAGAQRYQLSSGEAIVAQIANDNTTRAGTWRAMGIKNGFGGATLWLRIS